MHTHDCKPILDFIFTKLLFGTVSYCKPIFGTVIISFGQSFISMTIQFFFGTVSYCPIEVAAYPDAELDSVKRKGKIIQAFILVVQYNVFYAITPY